MDATISTQRPPVRVWGFFILATAVALVGAVLVRNAQIPTPRPEPLGPSTTIGAGTIPGGVWAATARNYTTGPCLSVRAVGARSSLCRTSLGDGPLGAFSSVGLRRWTLVYGIVDPSVEKVSLQYEDGRSVQLVAEPDWDLDARFYVTPVHNSRRIISISGFDLMDRRIDVISCPPGPGRVTPSGGCHH